jgi:hypothetical protein
MEVIWIILGCIAVLILFFYRPTVEKMTNKDLIETLSKFGQIGTKPVKKEKNDEEPLYGPKTTKLVEPTPADSKKGLDKNMVYPDIYGPEITPIPGKKVCKKKEGESVSDCADDSNYQYNPDLKNAFPFEGEPEPFLTDFSKIQH